MPHYTVYYGRTEAVYILIKKGASLSVVDCNVIKPSVKLRKSTIKPFK
jgi:hypothetical protein